MCLDATGKTLRGNTTKVIHSIMYHLPVYTWTLIHTKPAFVAGKGRLNTTLIQQHQFTEMHRQHLDNALRGSKGIVQLKRDKWRAIVSLRVPLHKMDNFC